jgi:hypothetical protein
VRRARCTLQRVEELQIVPADEASCAELRTVLGAPAGCSEVSHPTKRRSVLRIELDRADADEAVADE